MATDAPFAEALQTVAETEDTPVFSKQGEKVGKSKGRKRNKQGDESKSVAKAGENPSEPAMESKPKRRRGTTKAAAKPKACSSKEPTFQLHTAPMLL